MVLVPTLDVKDKSMTTQQDQTPDAKLSKSNHEAAARRSKAFGTFMLPALLSVLMLLGVGVFLLSAPDPGTATSAAPSASVNIKRPENVVALIAPRSVIDVDLLRDFETESGASVELVPYDNEESLLSIAGSTSLNADVILAAGTTIQQLLRNRNVGHNVLPARSIANLARIDPALRTLAKKYDADGLYSVPLAWTAIGLGVNRADIISRLGASQKLDTWSLLFDPVIATKLNDCGVYSVDASSLAFPSALLALGLQPFSSTPNDVERASAAWESIRPKVTRFDTRILAETLATGKACLALAPASEVYRARAMARDAAQSVDLAFMVPPDGTLLRMYMLAQPRGAQNASRGAMLIDYLLKPEVSARMTNTHWVANAVPASQLYVRQEIKDDPIIYADIDAFRRLTPEENPTPAAISLRERFWQLMNSGGSPTP